MTDRFLQTGTDAVGPDLVGLIGHIAGLIDHGLPPGDVAALRRLERDDVGSPALWKVIALVLEPAGRMPGTDPARTDAERAWASIIQALALLRGLHRPGTHLGRVLATTGFSEQRFLRLLRSSGPSLAVAIRGCAHWCASHGEPVDAIDLARLVLSDGRSDGETVRRQLARDYYGQLARGAEVVPGSEEGTR